jgi:tetratricopeptide (TPR) repeat protein
MIHRDYIMRMIAQFVKVLIKLLRLKESKEYETALATIGQTFHQFFGLSSEFINSAPVGELIALLKVGDILDTDKCVILADLLKEEAEVYEARNNLDESYHRYLKSLNLFLEAFLSGGKTNLSEYFSGIETVADKLGPYEIPANTKAKLWQYYEADGKFSKAEDLLFELVEADRSNEEVRQKGIYFYERLAQKSDGELMAGNLPRDEVHEGLARLHALTRKT